MLKRLAANLGLGRQDYSVAYTLWDKYTYAPRVSFNLLEKSGLFPMLDEPAEFDKWSFAFLGEG